MTDNLCQGLSAEDMAVQSMPDCSPTKWHLAHTSWFFENFVLQQHLPGYQTFDSQFHYLFNSYYESEGDRHPRPKRGLLTRPPLQHVNDYRKYVNEHMLQLLDSDNANPELKQLVVTGLHHEMQHQELMLTDILHAFSCNPLLPRVREPSRTNLQSTTRSSGFRAFDGGLVEIGAPNTTDFHYDNETPQHKVWLQPYRLKNHPVTNQEWLAFMDDGGYQQPLLWLSDGWAACQKYGWQAPGYWRQTSDGWQQFGLDGLRPIDPQAPVCHLSYYEAEAFARWAGGRLPWESEWEDASRQTPYDPSENNFLESALWRPQAGQPNQDGVQQLFGDVWEWTSSPYSAYPGFRPEQGALGEYNGKFMANQWVLRGGSCVTPEKQVRASYRNFFYPHQRWQFTGARLATDC